jgi:hypothetical protein
MLPILAAAQRRDDAIRAARREYERALVPLKLALQAKIDAAQDEFMSHIGRDPFADRKAA